MERRSAATDEDVVAVKGDVHRAELDGGAGALLDERLEAAGERDTARVDADEGERVEVSVALDELVGDPGESSAQCRRVQENLGHGGAGRVDRHVSPFRSLGTGLKGRE